MSHLLSERMLLVVMVLGFIMVIGCGELKVGENSREAKLAEHVGSTESPKNWGERVKRQLSDGMRRSDIAADLLISRIELSVKEGDQDSRSSDLSEIKAAEDLLFENSGGVE